MSTETWQHGTGSSEETSGGRRLLRELREIPILLGIAIVLALLIKTFLVQAFFIPSESMEPTLLPGDRVLVSRVPYWFGDPARGDIIVFEDPTPEPEPDRGLVGGVAHWLFQGLGVERPEEDFIKRVIGLPGDVVWARDGWVFVNGEQIDEPYLDQPTEGFERTRVPDGMLFVLGDNRGSSLDSRYSLGFVPQDSVVGKAFMVIWPPLRMDTI